MRAGVLLLLCNLFPASTMADDQTLQFLHEIRTRSYLLCSSAMLYFHPAIKQPDPRALISNYDSLMLLQTRTVQLGQPPDMIETQRNMQSLMETLEHMPRHDAGQYPKQVSDLLKLQRQADAWAESQYNQHAAETSRSPRGLHQQGLDMAKMLLNYQARSYPLQAGSYTGMTDAELEALDRAISERFELLIEKHKEFTATLERIRKNYRFVRAQVLNKNAHQSTGGIEFYLTRSIIDIDELANQTLATL